MSQWISSFNFRIIPHPNSTFRVIIQKRSFDKFSIIRVIIYSKTIPLIHKNYPLIVASICINNFLRFSNIFFFLYRLSFLFFWLFLNAFCENSLIFSSSLIDFKYIFNFFYLLNILFFNLLFLWFFFPKNISQLIYYSFWFYSFC